MSDIQRVDKMSYGFVYHYESPFKTKLNSQLSIYVVKVVSFRFQQYLILFAMLLVNRSSETWLFRDLVNHVFRSP